MRMICDDIFDFIRANHFFSFVEFQCYVKQCRQIGENLFIISIQLSLRFIKSLVWESEHGYVSRDFSDSSVVLVNPATGEPYELNSICLKIILTYKKCKLIYITS